MLRLTQRQINHAVFALMTVGAIAASFFMFGNPTTSGAARISIALYAIACSLLWIAYWRGWEYARQLLVAILTTIVVVSILEDPPGHFFSHLVYVVPVLALVLTGPAWVLGSALVIFGASAYRANGGPYLNPVDISAFVFVIGGMMLSRVAVDNIRYVVEAKQVAEAERERAEAERTRSEQKSRELEQRAIEQQQLLELVATLETPTITVGDGILLVPIVGTLDSRRAQLLATRVLQDVQAKRAQHVIFDISGVPVVDTQVSQGLLQTTQALRLLGCRVTLTGISPTVATTLTHIGIELTNINIARSPQEALAHL